MPEIPNPNGIAYEHPAGLDDTLGAVRATHGMTTMLPNDDLSQE